MYTEKYHNLVNLLVKKCWKRLVGQKWDFRPVCIGANLKKKIIKKEDIFEKANLIYTTRILNSKEAFRGMTYLKRLQYI